MLLQLKTDGEVAQYHIEEIENPKRLVVDLIGVNSPKFMKAKVDSNTFAGVRIGQHRNKTRIVVDTLTGALPKYDVASTDEGLVLVFAGPKREAGDAYRRFDQGRTFSQEDGFMRIAIDATQVVGVRTIANAPLARTIALDGARLQENKILSLRRSEGPIEHVRLIPDEYGHPVVKMQLKLREKVDHSIWQNNGKVLWDIRPVETESKISASSTPRVAAYQQSTQEAIKNLAAAKRRFRGKRITIDLLDAEIRNVLRFLSDVSGKNIVVAEDVSESVTKAKERTMGPSASRDSQSQRPRDGAKGHHHQNRVVGATSGGRGSFSGDSQTERGIVTAHDV